MTVYVDPAIFQWRGKRWCHMFTDSSIKELHTFAARIGLKRCWFQPDRRLPHYDITETKRHVAVKRGAKEVTIRFTYEQMQARRRGNGKAS